MTCPRAPISLGGFVALNRRVPSGLQGSLAPWLDSHHDEKLAVKGLTGWTGKQVPSVVTPRIAPSRTCEAGSGAFDAVRNFSDRPQARKAGIRLFSDKSICAMMPSR